MLSIQTKRPEEGKTSLHRYVLICVGCLFLVIGSFPIAYWRVSQSGKYNGLPFQSLSLEDHQKVTPASID